MNLSTGRVLIIVALVVGGLAVLANGFADEGPAVATPTGGTTSTSPPASEPPPSGESPTPTPTPNKTDVLFMALNGTEVPGAGAAAQTLLTADGYKRAQDAADAPVQNVKKTTVYYRTDDTGQNRSDATYVAKHYFGRARVKKLDPDFQDLQALVPESATIVIIVGEDYASQIIA